MSNVRIAVPTTLAAVLVIVSGCSGAEPDPGQAGQAVHAQPGPYGYVFEPDRVGATAAPAAAATPATVAGRIPPEDIQAVVRAGAGPMVACYQTALAAHPGLAGELSLHFTVGASGAPEGTRVERSTLPAGALDACVVAAFGALRFPASSAGVLTVLYPLRFEP